MKKKVEELQKTLEETCIKYEERIKRTKDEMITEMNTRITLIIDERSNIEQKHEKLKRSAKDNDQSKEKRLADLERERAILLEKVENLQVNYRNNIFLK